MDYTNESDPRNASIAVAVYPAGGGRTPKHEILGSLILNPGGPGGSGVAFVSLTGDYFDGLLDGKYNIVSFDPRGVGRSSPNVKCFQSEVDMQIYEMVLAANGLPGQHGRKELKHEVGTIIAEQLLLSDLCQNDEDAELMKYVGSPFVVRDMQLLHRALGDSKLNYWGFSYGSVLGSTYADMFPDDVNRVIVDGVVDMDNYYRGEWSHSFKDIELELDAFFDECARSGPEACELAKLVPSPDPSAENPSEGAALKELVLDWAEKLKHRPIALANFNPPEIYNYYFFIFDLFQAMYIPATWQYFAQYLYEAIDHNKFSQSSFKKTGAPNALGSAAAVSYQVACGDSLTDPPDQPWNISDYERYIAPIREDSSHFSEMFGQVGLMCNGVWPQRAVERYRGNFTANTSFPLLAFGNDYDPVTPGRYADKLANRFANAISVRREGYGHVSFSQPSKCMDDIVRDYFLRGELPALGTVCKVDLPVFGAVNAKEDAASRSAILVDSIYQANKGLF